MTTWDRREFLKNAGLVVGAAVLPYGLAHGAKWPTKPITAVIGYKPGGGTDFVSRAMAPLMESELSATIKLVKLPRLFSSWL